MSGPPVQSYSIVPLALGSCYRGRIVDIAQDGVAAAVVKTIKGTELAPRDWYITWSKFPSMILIQLLLSVSSTISSALHLAFSEDRLSKLST